MTDVQVSEADRVNRLVVQITEAAILALDADEDDTVRLAAFERGIVGYIEAALQSTAQLQAKLDAAETESLESAEIIGELQAEVERLRGASIALRDDLLLRAETDKDGCKVVACGAGVWVRFNDAIDTLTTNSGGE